MTNANELPSAGIKGPFPYMVCQDAVLIIER